MIASDIDFVKRNLCEPAILEQAAEECSELAQAFLKKARKLRGDNPTPKEMDEINENLVEEYTDLVICAITLDLKIDENVMKAKLERWTDRIANR